MTKTRKLLILGTGTIAEIAAYYFLNDSPYDLVGFANADGQKSKAKEFLDKPVWDWHGAIAQFPQDQVDFFVAIGYQKTNSVRQNRFEQIKELGYRCASYVSSRAMVFTDDIGENCFILENNVLQPCTKINNNVIMWSGNHLGHHSTVHENVFIASHAVISGKCTIGANSFLGVNCCLHDGVTIGEKSVVGAGAIVTESCEPRSVFNPDKTMARVIKRDLI
jgi:sugar O-acyltransferase (sialic acid O-acetyltransferase NeuD family)